MSELDTSSTNASHWAEHFCNTLKSINMKSGKIIEIDEGWVVGWFANYWAAVNDPLQKKIRELESNSAFFKSCALSGKIPKDGAEPHPQK